MNSNTVRGLAALALLCVLPKLGATVIQTATFQAYEDMPTSFHRSGAAWALVPYSNPNEPLTNVLVTATVEVRVRGREYNPYDSRTLRTYTGTDAESSLLVYSELGRNPYELQIPQDLKTDRVIGPTIDLAPRAYGPQVDHTYVFTHSLFFTAPSDLSHFLSNQVSIAFSERGYADTQFGTSSISVSIKGMVGYNIPDHGAMSTLLAIAALFLFLLHRRINLSRPGV